jgi:hypothetical protein
MEIGATDCDQARLHEEQQKPRRESSSVPVQMDWKLGRTEKIHRAEEGSKKERSRETDQHDQH